MRRIASPLSREPQAPQTPFRAKKTDSRTDGGMLKREKQPQQLTFNESKVETHRGTGVSVSLPTRGARFPPQKMEINKNAERSVSHTRTHGYTCRVVTHVLEQVYFREARR